MLSSAEVCVTALAILPALMGGWFLYTAQQGQSNAAGDSVAALDLGLTGVQSTVVLGVASLGFSCIVLLCACPLANLGCNSNSKTHDVSQRNAVNLLAVIRTALNRSVYSCTDRSFVN